MLLEKTLKEKKISFNLYAPTVIRQPLHYGDVMMMGLHFATPVVYSKCYHGNCFFISEKVLISHRFRSLKLHHEKRPLSMKTDIIKKRQRYESGPAAPKGKSSRKAKQEDGESSRMSPPEITEDNDPSGGNLEEEEDDDMDYKFQQYPQNSNNNQNSGSGNNMMMTGY